MDNSVLVVGLSLVVTFLTSIFKTVRLSRKKKNLIATVLSIGAGALAAQQSGSVSSEDIFGSIAAVYGIANFAYQFILKGTGLDSKLTNFNILSLKVEDVNEVLGKASETEKAIRKATKKTSSPAKKTTAKKSSVKGTSK